MNINPVSERTAQQIHAFFLNDNILKGFHDDLLTAMILIDLQKASETINHEILLRKLSIIGFSDDHVKCFPSYLSNRKFSVHF